MNEIVNIIDRRAGARGGRVCCVGRPVESAFSRFGPEQKTGGNAAQKRRGEQRPGGTGGEERGNDMHAARRRAAQRVRNARERRIEVITSLPFEDKRDILRFFRHIIGSADPAGPLIPARFSIRRAASSRSSGGLPARDEVGFEILKIVEKSGASGPAIPRDFEITRHAPFAAIASRLLKRKK